MLLHALLCTQRGEKKKCNNEYLSQAISRRNFRCHLPFTTSAFCYHYTCNNKKMYISRHAIASKGMRYRSVDIVGLTNYHEFSSWTKWKVYRFKVMKQQFFDIFVPTETWRTMKRKIISNSNTKKRTGWQIHLKFMAQIIKIERNYFHFFF